MKGIIMAGGEGTRLRPLTCDRPKPMVTIFDRPVMEYIISLLRNAGIKKIGVTLQYMPQFIMDYFRDGADFGVELSYFIEETPLGTAGSVKNAQEFLDEDFLVISGDCMSDFNLKDAISFHNNHKALATLVLSRVEEPLPYGVVVMDKSGKIERFVEKPTWPHVISDRVNTGIYVLKQEILDYIPKDTPYDFSKDLFKKLLEKKKPLFGCELPGYWCDIGDINAYLDCHFDLLSGRAKSPIPIPFTKENQGEAIIKMPCYIAEGAIVEKGACIGPYASLERGTVVKEGCKIARSVVHQGVWMGKKCEVKGALLCSGSKLKEGVSCFEGSVVGVSTTIEERATIGAGVKIWPQKQIEEGVAVTSDIVWGKGAKGLSLCDGVISGEFNAEITADFCAKLAFTVGTLCLDRGFSIGCGLGLGAEVLKNAVLSGGSSAGTQMYDCGVLSKEAFAFFIREEKTKFGIYVDLLNDYVTLSLFNSNGLTLNSREEKEICAVLQKGSAQKRPAKYMCPQIKCNNIAHRHKEQILQEIKRGEHTVYVGFSGDGSILAKEVYSLISSFGAKIYKESQARAEGLPIFLINGPQLSVLDEDGHQIGESALFLFLCRQYYKNFPQNALDLPPWAMFAVEGNSSLDEISQMAQIKADSSHSIVSLADNLFCIGLCLSFLSFGQVFKEEIEKIGPVFVRREEVYCPSYKKGRVMQKLIDEKAAQVPGCGGVQIPKGEGSVFITPHPNRPVCQIFATGYKEEISEELCGLYQRKIAKLQKNQ
jgi:mannose-1-phosphate guanylyltransferase/phosphomannomutase